MTSPSVLIVEDEENLRVALQYNLEREGYCVRTAGDGDEGMRLAKSEQHDLIILDVMLPGISGYDLCREIRRGSDVPILMLTAKGEEVDKVVGLELGADDYVTKPFGIRELIARVRALLRRPRAASGSSQNGETLTAGDLTLDLRGHTARKGEEVLDLRPREFDLLAMLMAQRGRAYTRTQILHGVWGEDYIGDERTVDVHVRWLRQKIEDTPSDPKRLVTVRGVGYRFEG